MSNEMNNTEIKNWLDQHGVENYTIRDSGIVDVDGGVNLVGRGLTSIPVQFGWVSGYFNCGYNKLTSLQHAPQQVGGGFYCCHNKLTSLQHAPQSVGGGFYCDNNKLTSLQHAPQSVGGSFYCSYNKLTSLQHAPQQVGGGFHCHHNNLTSPEGAPQIVGGLFDCCYNNLTSLHHIYKQIKQINGVFYCDLVPNMLGILMIKGVNRIDVGDIELEIERIFNKHLNGDIHACQEELIDAGYAEQAKL